MNVQITPATLELLPGTPGTLTVEIFNDAPIITAFSVRVFGLDPSWTEVDQQQVSLFPDTSGFFVVTVAVPRDLPSGTRRLAVEVRRETDGQSELTDVEVEVLPRHEGTVTLQPTSTVAGRSGEFGLVVANEGNATLPLTFSAEDEEGHLKFDFVPEAVELAPGDRETVRLVAKGRRPFISSPMPRSFAVKAEGQPQGPIETAGVLIQRPLFGRGLLGLLGLLVAAAVFAIVVTTALTRVVDKSSADNKLLLGILEARAAAGAPENPASISGVATDLTSGQAVAGVTVQLFTADNVLTPLASTATPADGAFVFKDLAEGTFKVRFQGAGFSETWFPRAASSADAEEIALKAGDDKTGINVQLGGVPATVAGTIVGDDPEAAVVTILSPAGVNGATEEAQVATAAVDQAGKFELVDVPSPATYDLRVERDGAATEVRRLVLLAGEKRTGIEIVLRKGDGLISGTIFGSGGPLGAATITATDGITTVTTKSLTRNGVGTYTLRNLATPGMFSVKVERQGHTAQSVNVALSAQEQRTGVDVTLTSSFGSISGTVSIEGEGAAGGVQVTVEGADVTLETVSLTAGNVGSYRVEGLPVPATYTLSFTRADLATQTRSVDLDALAAREIQGINATLKRSTATVSGTITESSGGAGIGGASITLTGGTVTLTTKSADLPTAGAYELRKIPPGTYTLTVSRPGSAARSVLVSLVAGDKKQVNTTLDPPATLSGLVQANTSGNPPLSGAEVKLYKTSQFPTVVLATKITGADGKYRFDGVAAPDQFTVAFSYPQGTPAQSSENVAMTAGEQRTLANKILEVAQ